MAFATIQSSDTKFGTVTSNSTTWTLTYPSNIAAGDLLLCFVAADGVGSPAISGWTRIGLAANAANTLSVFAKVAVGTETGTFSYTGDSEQGAWRVFRITGWYGGTLTAGTAFSDSSGLTAQATATGSPSATPDTPLVNPTQWVIEDTLWFAACSVDTSRTISGYPLAGNNTADVSGGAGGATLGLCTTPSAVNSLDPGTFTISASDDWATATVGVRPGVAVPGLVTGAQPSASGTLSKVQTLARTLSGSPPAGSGLLTRLAAHPRSLAGSQPAASGTLGVSRLQLQSVSGSQPSATAALTRLKTAARTLSGAQPAATGVLSRKLQALRSLTGSGPAASGLLAGLKVTARTLSGTQPAASGVLSRKLQALRALTGTSPAAGPGALSRLALRLRSLTGTAPSASSTLTHTLTSGGGPLTRSVAGSQPSASGALSRQGHFTRILTGSAVAASGTASRKLQALRGLSGTAPSALGLVTGALVRARTLTGIAPSASGAVSRRLQVFRTLVGSQPVATGVLTRWRAAFHSLLGSQPSAHATLEIDRGLGAQGPVASLGRLRGVFDRATWLTGAFDRISALVGKFDLLIRLRGRWGAQVAAQNQHDKLWTGDDHGILVTIEHPTTAGLFSPEWAVYAVREDLGGPTLVEKTLGAGISVEDADDWVLRIDLASEDTEALVSTARYHHGLQVTQQGRTSQVFDGLLTVHKSAAGEGS